MDDKSALEKRQTEVSEDSQSSSLPSASPSDTQPVLFRVLALLIAAALKWYGKLSDEWAGAAIIMALLPPGVARTFAKVFGKRK